MKKLALIAMTALLFAAFVSCQTSGTSTAAVTPKPTPAPVVAAPVFDITKSWTFEDTTVWTSSLTDGKAYAGLTAVGLGIGVSAIPAAQLPKTALINGKTINLTQRLQLPKLSTPASGALKVPMAGPGTLVIACLSSGSTAARDLVITNGKKELFRKTLTMVVASEADIISYTYTDADQKSGDGNVYLYTDDPGGAITLYYLGIAK
ncbi:MAG: hypothetical protein EHM28_11070 [Spirochaetaceae bacterium]|nr:MAG: hypothetical protein EHM28_11070 [Spirochaetaceae bacterium]